MTRLDLLRIRDRRAPVPYARRELATVEPDEPAGKPPLLFIGGDKRGGRVFAEHWLAHAAARGFTAHAASLRGQAGAAEVKGDLRALAHDVAQTAASLPARPVLIAHGKGGRILAEALGRYPARAAVFVSPLLGRLDAPTPAGEPPVLVVGDPDDKKAGRQVLEKAAAVYGVAPLLFHSVGHEMMLAAAWREPLDAILDWLDNTALAERAG